MANTTPQNNRPQSKPLEGVKNVIAVASGKGGVGKSTVSINLALALAHEGFNVGIVDADIYGPSLPMLVGDIEKPKSDGQKILPTFKFNLQMMSLGFLLDGEDQPVVWRGPMVMAAVRQFLRDVLWHDLDYLVVDLPPGTGDAHLTLTQEIPLDGAVIVSTPQDLALLDAKKGIAMFNKVSVPILGIIENMSYFECPKCHEHTHIFAHGGAKSTAEKNNIPFLGEIPLDIKIRQGGDDGVPIFLADPTNPVSKSFSKVAQAVIKSVSESKPQTDAGSVLSGIKQKLTNLRQKSQKPEEINLTHSVYDIVSWFPETVNFFKAQKIHLDAIESLGEILKIQGKKESEIQSILKLLNQTVGVH